MLTGKVKTDYQREYMRKYRAVRPIAKVLDPVRPKLESVRPTVRPQSINPMMAGYVPIPK